MLKKFEIEDLKTPTNNITSFFNDLTDNKTSLYNTELNLKNTKAELSEIYNLNSENREPIYNYLNQKIKETRKYINENTLSSSDKRIKLLNLFQEILGDIFKSLIPLENKTKLEINLPKNVFYDLLRQLKNEICFNGNKPALPQTNEEIARFLIESVSIFEGASLNTITKEISRQQTLKKGKLTIKKEY